MVMFFRLTNSPATFQAMINELLRDLINTGKVAVFIDDVIVGTENKKKHDELVAEIVKRLEENDLYIKLEKCKWKMSVMGHLNTNNFISLFFYFSDFILIFFFFSFIFSFGR